MIAVALARTVRRNKTRAVRRAAGGVEGANTTHDATDAAKTALKWSKAPWSVYVIRLI